MLYLVGCQTSAEPEMSGNHAAEVRRAIEQRISEWSRWIAAGQIDSIANAFTMDAWEADPNEPPVIGREAILEHWRRLMQMGTWSFESDVQEIIVTDTIAVGRSTYTLRFVPASSEAAVLSAFEDRGNWVNLWRLDPDGEWRIHWTIAASELPAGP